MSTRAAELDALGLIVEVVGPEEEKIKEIDLRTVSKILEFCEKAGLDVGITFLEKHESIETAAYYMPETSCLLFLLFI